MAHDPDLLDQLENLAPEPWEGTVYRYTGGGRSPEQENTAGARWNPAEYRRAMGFSADYGFEGLSKAKAIHLLGNAVPPAMAAHVIDQVVGALS